MILKPNTCYVVRCGKIITLVKRGSLLQGEGINNWIYMSDEPEGNLVLGKDDPHPFDIMGEYIEIEQKD